MQMSLKDLLLQLQLRVHIRCQMRRLRNRLSLASYPSAASTHRPSSAAAQTPNVCSSRNLLSFALVPTLNRPLKD
jgi:hypothetical protein